MSAENEIIDENEKIVVTKKKRVPTENQLKALEKARNTKAVKKEAVKYVETISEKAEKPDKKSDTTNLFFLIGGMGVMIAMLGTVIMSNKKLITESTIAKSVLEVKKEEIQPVEIQKEETVKEITAPQPSLLEPLKEVKTYSNLQLAF